MILRYLIATGLVLNVALVVKSRPANNDDNEDSISTEDKQLDSSQKNFKQPTASNRKWYITEKNLPEKNIREIPVDVIYDLEVKEINYEIRNVSRFQENGNKSNKKSIKEFIATKNIENSSDKNGGILNTEKNKLEKLPKEKEGLKTDRGNSQPQDFDRLKKLNESNSEKITGKPEVEEKVITIKLNPINNKINNTEEIYDKTARNKIDISSNVKREINKNKEFNNSDNTEKINEKLAENEREIGVFNLNEENIRNPGMKSDESQPSKDKEISNVSSDIFIENEGNPIQIQSGTSSKSNNATIRKSQEEDFEKLMGKDQEKTQSSLDQNRIQENISNQNSFNQQEVNSNSIISKLNYQNKFDNSHSSINTNYNNQDKTNENILDVKKEIVEKSNQTRFDKTPSNVSRFKNQEKFNTFINNLNIRDGNFEHANQFKIERIPSRDKIFQEKSDTYNKFNKLEIYSNATNDDRRKPNTNSNSTQDESVNKTSQSKTDRVSSHSNRYKYPEKSDAFNNFKLQEENWEKSTQQQYERIPPFIGKFKNQEKYNAENNTPNIQDEGVRKISQYKIEKIPITKYSDLQKLNEFNNFNTRESETGETISQNRNELTSSNRYKNQEKYDSLNIRKNQENNFDTLWNKNKVSQQKSNLETLKESIKKHYLSPEVLHINTLEDDFRGDQMRNNCVTHTIILNAPDSIQGGSLQREPQHENAQRPNPPQQTQPEPQQDQYQTTQKLQTSNQPPLQNTVPTNQYPSFNPYYPSYPAPNQFLFPNYNVPNWQNFDRRIPPFVNQPPIPYAPYFDPKRPLNGIANPPPSPYFNDIYNNYNDFNPGSPYNYGNNSPRKNDIVGENPYSGGANWNSVPPLPFFDRSYRNDEIYPGSNYYGNSAYQPNNHYGNQPFQPNYYNNPPVMPNNYETQGPYPHYAPPRASSPLSNYFPIVVHDPVKQFYTYLQHLVQYGPDADVCKLFKKFKTKVNEDNIFDETKHRNKVQRFDDSNENDEENFSEENIDLLRLKPRKGISRDVDRSNTFKRPLRGQRYRGRRRRRVLKRTYRNAPLKNNETLIGSEVKDLNSPLNEEYKSLPILGRPRKKRNAALTSDVTSDDETFVPSDQQPLSNDEYKSLPSLEKSRNKRNEALTSDLTSDDESFVPSDQKANEDPLATSDSSLTKIPTDNPLPSSYLRNINNDPGSEIRNNNNSSKDGRRQSRLFHQKGLTKSNSKNRVKVYDLEGDISGKGLGFNFKDHFKKEGLNVSDPNLHKVDIGPTIRKIKVKHGGVAIAGPGGIATAGSGGTAIVGPGGTAYTSPMPGSIAMVGPGGKVVPIPDPFHGYYRNSPLMAPPMTAPENAGMLSVVGPSGKTMQLKDGHQNVTETSRMFSQANTLLIPAGARLITMGPIIYYNPVYNPSHESPEKTKVKKR